MFIWGSKSINIQNVHMVNYIIMYLKYSYGEVYRLIYSRKSRFTVPFTHYPLNIHIPNTTEIIT